NNVVYGNQTGIDDETTGTNNDDRSIVRNNIVHDNSSVGISANGSTYSPGALVTGNTVYGQSGGNATGISGNGEIYYNIVYSNTTGINGSGWVHDNRVFNNSAVGIVDNGALVTSNKVYSNRVGIQAISAGYPKINPIANNIIYANT